MKRWTAIAVMMVCTAWAQETASQAEQESFQRALAETNNSPVDFVHAMESHLSRFPNSPRKPDLERALLRAALQLKDEKRTILYGERVLGRQPEDAQLRQEVSLALVNQGDQASAEKALGYASRLMQLQDNAAKAGTASGANGPAAARQREESERGLASALVLQARAEGILGHVEKAISLAETSYKRYPSVEAAREAARWYSAAGKDEAAIQYLADAFTIAEFASNPAKAADRERMGELYRKLKGNETGMGDLILQAYDRTSLQLAQHRAAIQAVDPNANLSDPIQFTLSSPSGDKLKLSSLVGNVVVFDFWATWCIPCRVQHPLYEQVKAKFKDRSDIIFVAVDTDEDHSVVPGFLQQNQWNSPVYFEDGLARALQVGSIPTTIVLDKKGSIASRMNGFLPDRFVDMLTERINEALGQAGASQTLKVSGVQ